MDNDLETLDRYIKESQTKLENRSQLRESNTRENIDYQNDGFLNRLDSSIKKNSAFVKRLKVFTESQRENLLNEIDRINLTKFTSEVASSIVEAKIKLNDIPAIVELCTKLNKTYRDFSKQLLDQYLKYFPAFRKRNNDSLSNLLSGFTQPVHSPQTPGSPGSSHSLQSSQINKNQIKNESNQLNPSKVRVDLRLFAELISAGIFPLKDGFPVLVNLLYYLMIYDKCNHQNANAILTFCKGSGDEFLGLVPKKMQLLATRYDKAIPRSCLVPLKKQELLRAQVQEYYQTLLKHLRANQEELEELLIRNKRIYKSKGEIAKEPRELVDIRRSECQKFQNVLQQLADLLGLEPPETFKFQNWSEDIIENGGDVEIHIEPGSSTAKSCPIWDDEGTRAFYEDLLDLRTLFPSLKKKISARQKRLELNISKRDDLEQNATVETEVGSNNTGSGSRDSTPSKVTEDIVDDLNKVLSSSSSEESLIVGDASSPQSAPTLMSKEVIDRTQPDQYFTKLSNCVNRDMIDNAAIDFVRFFNTKFGRRKLVKTLFNVQRTRLDLLPFFGRLSATLHPFLPSIGNELVCLLKQDFRSLFKKKDQINIESKVKNVRFIGELVKFELYSKQEALNCLKMLLSDFTHHHIEMTCNLLETCGRLLYRSSDSHHQLRLLLEQMMRKKLLLSVDSKYITMIENAYYFTNPPEIIKHVILEPPVHIYVRYLLCNCLNRSTIENVLQKIRKLNWSDKNLAKFVINCMIEAYNVKFYNIRYLAALLAAINKEHNWISVAVVDGVVEDILLMMEINELHFNQRRIPMIRYFGELYNYRLSDSSLVFKILYSLITYGVCYPEPEQSLNQIPLTRLDPPDNLFRVKLVCDLLDTCGQYLSCGQEKKKLDCYLLFFQRYYWCKRHIYMLHPYCIAKSGNQFPASIEYLYNDAVYNLRPGFQLATSYSQAIQSVQNFIDNLIVEQSS